MKTQQWTFVDKSEWPRGPWDDEPDKMQWQDEATGLPCLVHRVSLTGAWCGYVGVPAGHPWFALEYHALDVVNVHGCLTFANFCAKNVDENGRGICHVTELSEDARVWWLGFDCAHGGDLLPRFGAVLEDDEYRTIEYVRAECAALAAQASAAGAPPIEPDGNPSLTPCEYAALQARILELAQLDPAPSSPQGLELLRLADLVEAFEREHFKFEEPAP